MTTAQELTAIVGAIIVGAVAIIVALVKIFRGRETATCPVNAGDALDRLADAIHEQTGLLREIRDKLIGMGYEQNQSVLTVGRVENGMIAIHRRLDAIHNGRPGPQ